MPRLVDVPSGQETGSIYLIEYNEDLWLSYDDESKKYCMDTWIRKAMPIPGCRFVTLRLVPDDLFPIHGHETPYVAWQHSIEREPECGYGIEHTITVKTRAENQYLEAAMRVGIYKSIQGYPKGTRWRIVNKYNELIEKGKL